MSQVNDPTLTLWLALHRAVAESDDRLIELAQAQMEHPDVDVNAGFQGQSLVCLAASRVVRGVPVVPTDPFKVLPHHEMALALLDRGANPWLPLPPKDPVGMDAFMAAVHTNAWPVMRAFLHHPARPAWKALLEYRGSTLGAALFHYIARYPLLLHEMVDQGMDPNTRVHGVPLVFLMPTIDQAEWLVSQGADPTARSDEGTNLLGYRKHNDQLAPANEAERVRWAALMGRDQVDPVQVFMEGVRGVMSKLRPLFDKPAHMREWRWHLEGGRPLNLVDACAWGTIAGHSPASSSLRSLVKRCPDEASQDIAWLGQLNRHQQALDGTTPAPVDQERLLRAVRAWLDLDRRLMPHDPPVSAGHSGEGFATWLSFTSDVATRDTLLDLWMEWHQSSIQRWGRPTSFSSVLAPRLTEEQEATWAPRHRLMLTAHRLHRAMNETQKSRNNLMVPLSQREAQYRVDMEKVLEHVDTLVRARHEAGATFPDWMWMQLRAMITGAPTLGEEVERRVVASEREMQAQLQTPTTARSRLRS